MMFPRRGPVQAMLVPPRHRTILLRAGPWQIRFGLPTGGRYSNGSRWHSPWHRWDDDDGIMCWHDESQRLTEADKATRIVWPGKDDA